MIIMHLAESAFRVLNPEFYESYKNSKYADAALKFKVRILLITSAHMN